MKMKLLKTHIRNPGDGKIIEKEEKIEEIKLRKFKFNKRVMPSDKKRILFITCFSEFGCESLALMYCIPKIIQKYPGCYVVCVGWYGREYLYRHLVDEFWEIEEQFQGMREYSLAFQNTSKNIKKLEDLLEEHGIVYKGFSMGTICLGNTCRSCSNFWGDNEHESKCPACNSCDIERGLLNDIPYHKKFAVQIPRPSLKSLELAKKYLKPNPVGIFARGRVCYGRNLTSEFYRYLILYLEEQGYNPIWLGEKQSVLPCPVKHIVDFSSLPEARDLELTLAIISKLEFTIQFWTASTRLASMVGTPWILFESPEQIVGNGQEGMRIALTTDFNKKKLVLAQYKNLIEKEERAFFYVKQAIEEMKQDNWEDILGPVENYEVTKMMLKKQNRWRT